MNEIIFITSGVFGVYPFNIYKLLSIIDSAILPKTFNRIIIKDPRGEWFSNRKIIKAIFRCKCVESNLSVQLMKNEYDAYELIICKTK